MNWIETISTSVYRAAKFADAWFGLPAKAAESLRFRQDWRSSVKGVAKIDSSAPPARRLWIHGASVGELEDVAAFFLNDDTLAEARLSRSDIVLTAASVSAKAWLAKLNREGFAYAGPLPPEEPREVRAFLHTLRPQVMLISQSDLWPVALSVARTHMNGGAVWLPARVPERPWLAETLFRNGFVKVVAARTTEDRTALDGSALVGGARVDFIGNPRVDRILDRQNAQSAHPLESLGAAPDPDRLSILLGSCWPEDAAVVAGALADLTQAERERLQVVAIPHETRDPHLVASIQNLLPTARVLAVQGVLSASYRGFDAALVGGGFRTGLHNVVEPALCETPAWCGPRTRAQPEAVLLQKLGQLSVVHDSAELAADIRARLAPGGREARRQPARQARAALDTHRGATRRLAQLIGTRLDAATAKDKT